MLFELAVLSSSSLMWEKLLPKLRTLLLSLWYSPSSSVLVPYLERSSGVDAPDAYDSKRLRISAER